MKIYGWGVLNDDDDILYYDFFETAEEALIYGRIMAKEGIRYFSQPKKFHVEEVPKPTKFALTENEHMLMAFNLVFEDGQIYQTMIVAEITLSKINIHVEKDEKVLQNG